MQLVRDFGILRAERFFVILDFFCDFGCLRSN